MDQPHAVLKDDVLVEHAGSTAGRCSIRHYRRHTVELDSSSADAPSTWDAARCPEYAAEVDVMADSALDFDPDFVIVAAVIAALPVAVLDPDLDPVQIAVAVDGFLPVGSVAPLPDAVRSGVKEHTLHAVWHCIQSGCYGRFASFRRDHLPGES